MKIDMTGFENETLRVKCQAGTNKYGDAQWECECKLCGNSFITLGYAIRNGHTKSCGCLQKIVAADLKKTCGMSHTNIYKLYHGIKQRCYNPKTQSYKDYGGKGIAICDEWLGKSGFEAFYQWSISTGYQFGLTIDRIDNSKGYSPQNCRWATRAEQNRNTSRTNRRKKE